MHQSLIDLLQCPACRGALEWNITEQHGEHIEAAEARCTGPCLDIYAVREGIGLFLTPDLPREDLWEQVDSQLTQFLRTSPDIEAELMETPLEQLNATDRTYRAYVLEERQQFEAAELARQGVEREIYTPEYLACQDAQVQVLLDRIVQGEGPILDLASGRGFLVEKIARACDRPIVATDFSPSVLRRDRRRFQSLGFEERVSLLAFDARRTPFKDGAVQTMTTFLGLPNIIDPGLLLIELRRILAGEFLAVHFFFPEDDQPNLEEIRLFDLEDLLVKPRLLDHFRRAGWKTEIASACSGKASPTPSSNVLPGARVDGMPVADTILEWCVLRGTP